MTTKEFEKLGKCLLPGLPNFTVKGQLLFIQPVGHTLRGVYFARSSEPRNFYVQIFIQPLFISMKHVGFNIGWRLGGGCHAWNADTPNLIPELGAALKREAAPFLTSVHSPRDTADAAISLDKSGDPIVQQAIAYAFARAGDVEKAKGRLDELIHSLDLKVSWQQEMAERAQLLKAKLIIDPAEAQKQLEAWENETVKNLGLEKFR